MVKYVSDDVKLTLQSQRCLDQWGTGKHYICIGGRMYQPPLPYIVTPVTQLV